MGVRLWCVFWLTRNKTLSEENGQNKHAHSVRFPGTRFLNLRKLGRHLDDEIGACSHGIWRLGLLNTRHLTTSIAKWISLYNSETKTYPTVHD